MEEVEVYPDDGFAARLAQWVGNGPFTRSYAAIQNAVFTVMSPGFDGRRRVWRS
jgi:hypothetical protein